MKPRLAWPAFDRGNLGEIVSISAPVSGLVCAVLGLFELGRWIWQRPGSAIAGPSMPLRVPATAFTFVLGGATGALIICSRQDPRLLFCFPERESARSFVVSDTYAGRPLPATLALAGRSNTVSSTDYRGHLVIASYRPIADTGLGLVLRMDAAEIYAPLLRDLLAAIPLPAGNRPLQARQRLDGPPYRGSLAAGGWA